MRKKPTEFQASLVAPHSIAHLAGVGVILSFGVMASYFYGLTYSPQTGQTMAFTTLVLLEFVRLSSVRAEYKLGFFSNPLVIIALVVSLGLQVLLIYTPALQGIFRTVPLSGVQWGVILLSSFCTWVVYKLFRKVFP